MRAGDGPAGKDRANRALSAALAHAGPTAEANAAACTRGAVPRRFGPPKRQSCLKKYQISCRYATMRPAVTMRITGMRNVFKMPFNQRGGHPAGHGAAFVLDRSFCMRTASPASALRIGSENSRISRSPKSKESVADGAKR